MNQKNTDNIRLILRMLGLAICGALITHAWAAEPNKSAFPGTDDGATSLLKEFLKPDADHAALTKALRPTTADYAAVFEPEVATKLEARYEPDWNAGKAVIAPKLGQSELKLFSATTDELKSWTGGALKFAGGWKRIGPQLKSGFKIYRFDFVEPGKTSGLMYDGLIYVNGNWRMFPKAWRVMGEQP